MAIIKINKQRHVKNVTNYAPNVPTEATLTVPHANLVLFITKIRYVL
jgi:hypothetical protein